MKIATVIVATKSYLDPLEVCLRRVKTSISKVNRSAHKLFIVTDKESVSWFEGKCNWIDLEIIPVDMQESGKHYDKERQILIASLQSTGFDAAREWGCDLLWSVEADVLVPPNALTTSMQMLDFDDHYYDVAFVTYPSQGGGSFLGGHGDYRHNIADCYKIEEREVPAKLMLLHDECKKRLDEKPVQKETERWKRIQKKLKECPPKGNVFELNAKKWRRRGWLDNSHPGIGRGAVIETDWTGLGCTLMSRRAAELAHFDGYDGGGTQDLYLNWHKWHPAGMRFCCITHTICDHVVRKKGSDNEYEILKAYHEPDGETRGHLRYARKPFNKFTS